MRISAQAHLERFYGEWGFERVGEPYLEDDIPHLEMIRPADLAAAEETVMQTTHEVTNQSTPYTGVNLFRVNRPLRDALRVHTPGLDTTALDALGAEAGAAALQAHARRAHAHPPVLHTHDRHGRRIDEVEFHPSYHALLGSALRHGLHGTPWSRGPGGHIERAAAFMLFTEAEPSVLCPVSMTYAVTPALRANPALQAAWGPKLASTAYDERFLPFDQKTAGHHGHGHDREAGRLGRAQQHHARRRPTARTGGAGATASPATSGSSRRRCATRSWCWPRPPAA